jgi:predicted DCC family thiol-disulfide oxidoreductase YuxK
MPQSEKEQVGWLLYDGSCGLCSRWVPFFESTLTKQGLGFAPLQAEWVRERLALSEEELLADLRLLLGTGVVISGPEVYRYVMRKSLLLWPLYLLSVTPGLSQLFDWSYRTFANHRYEVSAACRLSAEFEKGEESD